MLFSRAQLYNAGNRQSITGFYHGFTMGGCYYEIMFDPHSMTYACHKDGEDIWSGEYWKANCAFMLETFPDKPLVAEPPFPATVTPEGLKDAFNTWGRENIVLYPVEGAAGYFTEEAVEPAEAFMAKSGYQKLNSDEAKRRIAKNVGFANVQHLGLEHNVEAAWRAPDGRIIFYCSLQGRMFMTNKAA